MGTPTTVGINDNLSSGQSCIAMRAADNELTGWVNMIFDLIVKEKFIFRIFLHHARHEDANDILADIFHHQTIAWGNTDSKYKMFLGAFQQLEKFLSTK